MLKNSKISSLEDIYIIENAPMTIDRAYIYLVENYSVGKESNKQICVDFLNSMSPEFKIKLAKILYGSLLWFYTILSEKDIDNFLNDKEISHNIAYYDEKSDNDLNSEKVKLIVYNIIEDGYLKETESFLKLLSESLESPFKLDFFNAYDNLQMKDKLKFLSNLIKYPMLEEYLAINKEKLKEVSLELSKLFIDSVRENDDKIFNSPEVVLSFCNILQVVDDVDQNLLIDFISALDYIFKENFKDNVLFSKKSEIFVFFTKVVKCVQDMKIEDEKKNIFKEMFKAIVKENKIHDLLNDIVEIDKLDKDFVIRVNVLPFYVLLYGWSDTMSEMLDINLSERMIDFKNKVIGKTVRLYSLSLNFEKVCFDALSENFKLEIVDSRGANSFDYSLSSVFVLKKIKESDLIVLSKFSEKIFEGLSTCKPKELKFFLSDVLEKLLIENEKDEMKSLVLSRGKLTKPNKF